MADIAIETGAYSTSYTAIAPWGPYWYSKTVGVIVGVGTGTDLAAWYTEDGGDTWSAEQILKAGTVERMAAMLDRVDGKSVRVAYVDGTSDVLGHAAFDMESLTWGTENETSHNATGTNENNRVGITMSPSGYIGIAAVNSGTASTFLTSVDGGVNFVSKNTPFESDALDSIATAWADMSDQNDMAFMFWDASANQITVKTFDHSTNTWAENTGGALTAAASASYENWRTTYRESDKATLIAAFNEVNTTTADIITGYVVVSALTGLSITATANALTNPGANFVLCSIFCDHTDDSVYVPYLNGSSWESTMGADYVKSVDDMASWGSPVALSEDSDDDLRVIHSGDYIASQGGRFQPVWFNDDLNDYLATNAASFDIDAVSSGASGTLAATLGSVAASFTGAQAIPGSFAAALASVLASFTGAQTLTGTLAATTAPVAADFTGTQEIPGTVAAALASVVASFTGTMEPSGTITATLGAVSASFTGTQEIPGTLAATTPAVAASFSGAMEPTGTFAASTGAVAASFTGTQGAASVTGTLAASLSPIAVAFTGTQELSGTLSATLASIEAGFTGTQAIPGTLAAATPAVAAIFTGTQTDTGTFAATTPAVAAAFTGAMAPAGTLTATLAAVLASFTGTSAAPAEVAGTVVLSEGAGPAATLTEGAQAGVGISAGAASGVALSEGAGGGLVLSGAPSHVEVT